ncbi:prohead protease [Dickeya phage Sucellus]|nr:prohead protease [Dickeya phage Sucellus]
MIDIEALKKMAENSGQFEKRSMPDANFEVKDDGESGSVITGYAAVYDIESDGLPWVETYSRGCFDGADYSMCKCLWNHDEKIVLSSTKSGSLKITTDNRGVFYSSACAVNDYIEAVVLGPLRRGDVDKSSIRFIVDEDEWRYDEANAIAYRSIIKVSKVLDVSPVTFPAYSSASSTLRSAIDLANINIADIKSLQDAAAERDSELRRFF